MSLYDHTIPCFNSFSSSSGTGENATTPKGGIPDPAFQTQALGVPPPAGLKTRGQCFAHPQRQGEVGKCEGKESEDDTAQRWRKQMNPAWSWREDVLVDFIIFLTIHLWLLTRESWDQVKLPGLGQITLDNVLLPLVLWELLGKKAGIDKSKNWEANTWVSPTAMTWHFSPYSLLCPTSCSCVPCFRFLLPLQLVFSAPPRNHGKHLQYSRRPDPSFFCWPGIPAPAHFCSPHWPHYPWKDTPCVVFYHPPRITWGQKDKWAVHFHLVGGTYNTDGYTDRWSWGCSVLADGSSSRESFYISNNFLSLHFQGFCLSYRERSHS